MAAKWTDEIRKEMADDYIEKMEIAGNDGNKSMDIVNEIRESFAQKGEAFTSNAIRLMLMAQKRPTDEDPIGIVYIKKTAGSTPASSGTSASTSSGTAKLSKAEAQKQLSDAISAINPDLVDSSIIDKMTGKAAQYFMGVVLEIQSTTPEG